MYVIRSVPPQTLTLDKPMYTSKRNVDVTCVTKLFTLKVRWESINTEHQYRHVEDAKHGCSQSEKRFIRKSDLTAHMVVHSRTLKCKYPNYGKTVTDRRYLNSHYKIHPLDFKYGCPKKVPMIFKIS